MNECGKKKSCLRLALARNTTSGRLQRPKMRGRKGEEEENEPTIPKWAYKNNTVSAVVYGLSASNASGQTQENAESGETEEVMRSRADDTVQGTLERLCCVVYGRVVLDCCWPHKINTIMSHRARWTTEEMSLFGCFVVTQKTIKCCEMFSLSLTEIEKMYQLVVTLRDHSVCEKMKKYTLKIEYKSNCCSVHV